MSDNKAQGQIAIIPEMCITHQLLLIQRINYLPSEPLVALIVVTQVTLFKMAMNDPAIQKELDGNIAGIDILGCLACKKPEIFDEIVRVAKSHNLKDIETLGDEWSMRGMKGAT